MRTLFVMFDEELGTSKEECATLVFETALVERVVDLDLWSREEGGDLWARRYRAACDAASTLAPSDRRELLTRLAATAFDELGHSREARSCLGPLARRAGGARTICLRMARDDTPEGSDFLSRPPTASPSETTIAVQPSRFVDDTLRPFLLVELERLEEILDPAFAYEGAQRPISKAPDAAAGLDRLAKLWHTHARAMLARRGLAEPPVIEGGRSILESPASTFPDLVELAFEESGATSRRSLGEIASSMRRSS